MGVVFSFGKNF